MISKNPNKEFSDKKIKILAFIFNNHESPVIEEVIKRAKIDYMQYKEKKQKRDIVVPKFILLFTLLLTFLAIFLFQFYQLFT